MMGVFMPLDVALLQEQYWHIWEARKTPHFDRLSVDYERNRFFEVSIQ